MVRWTLKCLKSKKGSALILVMAALILLMSISSVVVALSAANVRMSRRYSDWSKEFYWLDYIAEERLSEIDSQALLPAELLARKYVQEECYKAEAYEDLSPELTVFLAKQLQEKIHEQWLALEETIDAMEKGEVVSEGQKELMKAFYQRAFAIVYAAAVESHLQNERGLGDRRYPFSGRPAELDYPIDSSATVSRRNWLPDNWASMSFDAIYNGVENGAPTEKIVATEADVPEPKRVEVNVILQIPQYDAVSQTRYFVVKPNPLYANALSVQGSVFFEGGNIKIEGDLAAAARNRNGGLQKDGRGRTSTDEGNSLGVIITASGTHVTVSGNIYTGGDVHLGVGVSDSSIVVTSATQGNTLKSRLLYGAAGEGDDNPYWFDVTVNTEALAYTEEAVGESRIPYIYKDSEGGNVYCNNLAIEEGVTRGSLSVAGSVWTQDDIQNDGQAGTSITVKGNYIGMSSEAEVGGSKEGTDPNASSAVINNALPYGGTIEIDGLYVIPGTAFYELYSSTRAPEYYQTAESINAKGGEFFKVYLLEEGAGGKTYYVSADPGDDEHYNFFEGSLEAKRDLFENVVSPSINDYNSNVYLNPDAVRYILGVGVTKWGASGRVVREGADMSPQFDFYTVKDTVLPDVYKAKTVNFGTNGYGFFDLIDTEAAISDPENGFYVFRGEKTINFDTDNVRSGIIYCGGDLTITGGTFRGAIVCAGNVTIRGNTTITYNESAIRSVLGVTEAWQLNETGAGSAYARRFFSPGGYAAKTSFGVDAYVVTAGADEDLFTSTRYTVKSWEEINA